MKSPNVSEADPHFCSHIARDETSLLGEHVVGVEGIDRVTREDCEEGRDGVLVENWRWRCGGHGREVRRREDEMSIVLNCNNG